MLQLEGNLREKRKKKKMLEGTEELNNWKRTPAKKGVPKDKR